MTRRRMVLSGFGLAAVVAVALTGCATPAGSGGGGGTTEPAPAPDASAPAAVEVDAAWLDDGRSIGIVTQGSSTCVPMAEDATYADGVLTVTLVEPEDAACTRDLVPRVSLVGVPEGVDPAEDLDIVVDGEGFRGETELDGVSGLAGPGGETQYAPSAGWTNTDGQFVVLTWGSSSCAPVFQEVVATGPAEVTATVEEPPADQVCTMDMAPRAAVLVVDGLEEDDAVELILTGSPEFADVRTPILGSN
ncbi:hypothetical protein ABXJ56_07860 [Microbacterium chocolatum]|uniref:hypothetical protein n=1 Tax=Microbacterium aurantiacum TaxID=162393 RepID=UPI00338FE434